MSKKKLKYTGVHIKSVDAKDLYISNTYIDESQCGYKIRNKNGEINVRKFINTLDYSLDLIKLREIYQRVYRNKNFSFAKDGKEYTRHVINVTFNYSNKEFNRVRKGLYIKYGYSLADVELDDCVCVRDGELIAIQTYEPSERKDRNAEEWRERCTVHSPVDVELLGSFFEHKDGFYTAKKNIKVLNSVADIRAYLYNNGFTSDGIEYVRWKRSAGSGRVGKCLFIDKRLYGQMNKWEMCGIKIRKGAKVDLAALESYISLTTSSIIDTLEIYPENILVIDDFESKFTDTVMATRCVDGRLVTAVEECEINNSIWDGQSLLDVSMFGKYRQYGMLLLRSRFFKTCCFNTNIQQWFSDRGIVDVGQLRGFTLAEKIEDIKLITTPSNIKFLKFGTLNEWFERLDPVFGIVKHEKPTHYFNGRMVQCHYQLLNTIQLTYAEVGELLKQSFDFLRQIKTNPAVVRDYIKYQEQGIIEPSSVDSKNDIVYRLLGLNEKFAGTKLYHQFLNDLIKSVIRNLRKGHVLVRGNYSTLFGNPVEMLKQAIGAFDGSTAFEKGTVHNLNFNNGEELLGTRSPHVTIANVLLCTNHLYPEIQRYFNLTKEIVCVNSIDENLLERLSGADFDSDTMALTNNRILIAGARRNYNSFSVPTKLVKPKTNLRKFTHDGKANLDITTSVNKIGEIINLSQELNSKLWDLYNGEVANEELERIAGYYRDVSQLDVMSNLEIDSAKRENPADNTFELKKIKERHIERDEYGRHVRPMFFKYLDKDKGYYNPNRKAYRHYNTTMDFLQKQITALRLPRTNQKFLSFSEILKTPDTNNMQIDYKRAKSIIQSLRRARSEIVKIYNTPSLSKQEKYFASSAIRQEYIEQIKSYRCNDNTMYYLLTLIEQDEYSDISVLLFNTLFGAPNESFYKFIAKSKEPIGKLVENELGDIQIYGQRYSVV